MTLSADTHARLRTLALVLLLIMPASIAFGWAVTDHGIILAVVHASIGTTIIIGLPIFAVELFYVTAPAGAKFRRLPLALFLMIRLGAWMAWIVTGSMIANRTVWQTPVAAPFVSSDFWLTVGFSAVVGAVAMFVMTINALLGPGVLVQLMLGRYHRPRTEEVGVAFIDLKNSTAIADAIGPERFLEVMARFAALVSAEARAAGGSVYAYVGDEVIVEWHGKRTADLTRQAAMLVALKRRLARDRDNWARELGVAPDFRASLHVGPVVIGEMGDDKRAIVLLGDTMNVAARLEQAARDLGVDIVCSADAARRVGPIAGVDLTPLGPVVLRGKDKPVPVIGIETLTL